MSFVLAERMGVSVDRSLFFAAKTWLGSGNLLFEGLLPCRVGPAGFVRGAMDAKHGGDAGC